MIQGILGSRLSVRPTKRKVVKTVSAMEQGAKLIQTKSAAQTRVLAGKAAEFLGNVKHKLVKGA